MSLFRRCLSGFAAAALLAAPSVVAPEAEAGLRNGWPEVFFDNFNNINANVWGVDNRRDFGNPNSGWFHPSNVLSVRGGNGKMLQIWNKWEPRTNRYEGGYISTKRFRIIDGGDLEAKLRLSGRAYNRRNNIWPSWWTFSTAGGGDRQEADIMEKFGRDNYSTSWHLSDGSFKNPDTRKNTNHFYSDRWLTQFRRYGCLLKPGGNGEVVFHRDNGAIRQTGNGVWKKKPMKLIFSSTPHRDRLLKVQMPALWVDWVRVRYQRGGR